MHKVCAFYIPADYSVKNDMIEMEFTILNENEAKDIANSISHDDIAPMYQKIEKIINKVNTSPSYLYS